MFWTRSLAATRVAAIGLRCASTTPLRSSQFSELNASDVAVFRSILGDAGVLSEEPDTKSFNSDWMKQWHGSSKCVLLPSTTDHVSAILAHCNERKLAVVPQGGNTGLVGGGVPLFDEIILSTRRMNKILDLDKTAGVLTCQSGLVLEEAQAAVAKEGFTVPLDLGAKGSCQLGGNLSTNAGGLRVVRYGILRGSVLGLEAVLADGTVVDSLSTVRKDNTGYDIKQLFIGSEGTLGVITKLALLIPPLPTSVNVLFLSVNSFEEVLAVKALAGKRMADIISAVEFLDRGALEFPLNHLPGARDPFSSPHPFYLLIETSGFNAKHDQEVSTRFYYFVDSNLVILHPLLISFFQKVHEFLEAVASEGLIQDGTMAQDSAQVSWRYNAQSTNEKDSPLL